MVSLASDILVFNSKDKNTGDNQDANYNLVAMGGIGAPPSSVYELLSFHTINHFYNVETGINDKIYFIENAGSLVATLDPGNYTTATLLTEIVAQLAAAGVSTYVGSSYDSDTGKYTFASLYKSVARFTSSEHSSVPSTTYFNCPVLLIR